MRHSTPLACAFFRDYLGVHLLACLVESGSLVNPFYSPFAHLSHIPSARGSDFEGIGSVFGIRF